MTTVAQSPYTKTQIVAWLRGLLTIAWVDGHYDAEERELIEQLTGEMTLSDSSVPFKSITPTELATDLGKERATAENFLRTAVMVAIADGVYSTSESQLLKEFSQALEIEVEALKSLEHTVCESESDHQDQDTASSNSASKITSAAQSDDSTTYPHSDLLQPVKSWLDGMEVEDPKVARFICKMVPSQCPFERDVKLFGDKVVHIPALCKLNPLYEQLVGLRFRALSYLADECDEDVSDLI